VELGAIFCGHWPLTTWKQQLNQGISAKNRYMVGEKLKTLMHR